MDKTEKIFSFFELAQKYGNSPAIVTSQKSLTFYQFAHSVNRGISRLSEIDIKKGERVAIFSPNSMEFLALLVALWYVRAVAIPVSTRWSANQISTKLMEINCQRIIISDHLRSDFVLNNIKVHPLESLISTKTQIEKKIQQEAGELDLAQDATIIFTSGSANMPKGVLHTLANHYYSALGSNENISFQPGDRWILSLPLYHVAGLAILFRAILSGGTMVLPGTDESLATVVMNKTASHISLVHTQFYRLMQKKNIKRRLSQMKAVLLGGSAVPESLVREAHKLGIPIYTSYGSTEMASQITTTQPDDSLDHLLTSGRILPFRKLSIADDGEILVKGQTLCKGYVEGHTFRDVRNSEGWFHSGDMGKLDEKQYLIIKGRLDNMFISGGENIQPEEIEQYLKQIDNIAEAVVVPIPDPEFGMRPVAFLEGSEGSYNIPEIREFLAKHLPGFKIPDRFLPFPDTLSNRSMKINRKKLKEIAKHQLLGDRA